MCPTGHGRRRRRSPLDARGKAMRRHIALWKSHLLPPLPPQQFRLPSPLILGAQSLDLSLLSLRDDLSKPALTPQRLGQASSSAFPSTHLSCVGIAAHHAAIEHDVRRGDVIVVGVRAVLGPLPFHGHWHGLALVLKRLHGVKCSSRLHRGRKNLVEWDLGALALAADASAEASRKPFL
eukprot:scaffold1913_cov257-Pinguiococcus_pyrenoidosus.AAC.4